MKRHEGTLPPFRGCPRTGQEGSQIAGQRPRHGVQRLHGTATATTEGTQRAGAKVVVVVAAGIAGAQGWCGAVTLGGRGRRRRGDRRGTVGQFAPADQFDQQRRRQRGKLGCLAQALKRRLSARWAVGESAEERPETRAH